MTKIIVIINNQDGFIIEVETAGAEVLMDAALRHPDVVCSLAGREHFGASLTPLPGDMFRLVTTTAQITRPPTPPETCETCKFWRAVGGRLGFIEGRCSRNPPQVIDESCHGYWPLTRGNSGCGEYKPKPGGFNFTCECGWNIHSVPPPNCPNCNQRIR